ncbi:hypothetical protein [Haliscomenobacter sp.]|uniref:hypothetical protein n=1 Tax=Haliscomenobacter sp. TaxID=2717303 RepID=UPI003364F5F5
MKEKFNMDEKFKPFVAGFDLAGQRLPNGKLQCYGNRDSVIDDWPQEVRLFDNTYTLEDVVKGVNGYESGVYV